MTWPYGIGVDDARAQRRALERHRVVVGRVVVEPGARAARLHPVRELAEERLHRGRACPCRRRRVVVAVEGRAARRARLRPAIAVAEPERQPQLPGEVGAQEVRQVGAVRRRRDRRLVLGIVLAQAEVAVEEVARRIAQRLVQRAKIHRLIDGRVEQRRDPRRVEVLVAPIPGVRRRPHVRAHRRRRRGRLGGDRDLPARDRLAAPAPDQLVAPRPRRD